MLSILIQRFWMEFIDDFEVLAGTYQRFWNSEVPDRIYQRYWNSEFWMEPIDDLKFRGSGCQIMALNSYFEGPGSVYSYLDKIFVLQFLTLKMKVPGLWRQQVLRFLDFEDNGFFNICPNLLDSHFEDLQLSWKEFLLKKSFWKELRRFLESSLNGTLKVHDFLDKNFFWEPELQWELMLQQKLKLKLELVQEQEETSWMRTSKVCNFSEVLVRTFGIVCDFLDDI
ncbi:uncharacterized protein OCT59_026181 [Rhizophagus irregularis]|uniref:uncharacterized protein n=1 Tax=Rhizophagus irregularis TaxID=588596 RepID=UPI0033273924|nr:hypothetical protein OCT59_026181 [Rhizophagus irregularis]